MRLLTMLLVAGSFLCLLPQPGMAASWQTRERAARKACLTGNPDKGVAILADLFIESEDLTYIFNQGRCLEQNRRYEDAIGRFREYLIKGERLKSADRAEAEKHIAACQSYLGKTAPVEPIAEPPRPALPPPTVAAPAPAPALKAPPTSGQAYSSCTGQYTTLPEAISEIVAGGWHFCVLAADKGVRCWGLNTSGQLGSGDTTSPIPLPGARISSFTATHLTAGRKFNCALTSDQRNVSCWGTNSSLQISPETAVTFYPRPTSVALNLPEGLTVSTVESSPEASHVCAIISDGSLVCWGNNSELETGTGATGGQATPAFVIANW